jgi:hypothetical protein
VGHLALLVVGFPRVFEGRPWSDTIVTFERARMDWMSSRRRTRFSVLMRGSSALWLPLRWS